MTEFWESSFNDKQTMWGFDPADAAIATLDLFRKKGIKEILIPGYGYGRNAKIFTDHGISVTGIKISTTAIDLAKKHLGDNIKVHHGSVTDMPFDQVLYPGIFCYALIHLLHEKDRARLIRDCYHQLKSDGTMVFVALSKNNVTYREGIEISKDRFASKHGVSLFFYDSESVDREFGQYGLMEAERSMNRKRIWRTSPHESFGG